MPPENYKTITISEELYREILSEKKPSETFEDTVRRLLRMPARYKYQTYNRTKHRMRKMWG